MSTRTITPFSRGILEKESLFEEAAEAESSEENQFSVRAKRKEYFEVLRLWRIMPLSSSNTVESFQKLRRT